MSWGTTYPECPKCGREDKDYLDSMSNGDGDGAKWRCCCDECGTDYEVTVSISYSFSTKEVVE